MSVSTLEEVFLRIAEEDHAAEAKRLITGGGGGVADAAPPEGEGEGAAAAGAVALAMGAMPPACPAGDQDRAASAADFGRGCVRAPFRRQVGRCVWLIELLRYKNSA
jgi:hypothetical protein